MKSEPVLIIAGACQAFLAAVLGVLFAFVDLDKGQTAAISTLAVATVGLVIIVATRGAVYAPETVETRFFPKTKPAPPD